MEVDEFDRQSHLVALMIMYALLGNRSLPVIKRDGEIIKFTYKNAIFTYDIESNTVITVYFNPGTNEEIEWKYVLPIDTSIDQIEHGASKIKDLHTILVTEGMVPLKKIGSLIFGRCRGWKIGYNFETKNIISISRKNSNKCSNLTQMPVDTEIKTFIRDEIAPLYDKFDKTHQREYLSKIINTSLLLAQKNDVDINMVYIIAAYHDTGLRKGWIGHAESSEEFLKSDERLREWFEKSDIAIMGQACRSHHCRYTGQELSIYEKIIIDASLAVYLKKKDLLYYIWQIIKTRNPTMSRRTLFEKGYKYIQGMFGEDFLIRFCLPDTKAHFGEEWKETKASLKSKNNAREWFYRIIEEEKWQKYKF